MKIALPLLFLFSITFCIATCESNQININTASLTELDKLVGIGPAYAQDIINARPYTSVDDLDKAKNIGPSRLEKIKTQGLACVGSEPISYEKSESTSSQAEESEEITPLKSEKQELTSKVIQETEEPEEIISYSEEQNESIINLNYNTNSVKEKVVYESRNEIIRKYAIYAFVIFLIVAITFLLLNRNGRAKDYSSDDY